MNIPITFGWPQFIFLLVSLIGVALVISLIVSFFVKDVEVFELEKEREEGEQKGLTGNRQRKQYLRRRRRRLRWARGGTGVVLIVLGVSLLWLTFLTQTYLGLTSEIKVAQIQATKVSNANHEMSVNITLYDDSGHALSNNTYILQGDEWMLQGDIIRFPTWLNVLGIHSGYKVTRLEGRYDDIHLENTAPHTAIALNGGDDNFFQVANSQKWWFSWFVDASYGNAVIQTTGTYNVFATQDALIARPAP